MAEDELSPDMPPGVAGEHGDQDIFQAIQTWRDILKADKRLVLNEDGSVKPPTAWPDRESTAIASYSLTANGFRITFHSPTDAARALAQFKGGAEALDDETAAIIELFHGLSREQKRQLREFLEELGKAQGELGYQGTGDDDEFNDGLA